MQVADPVGSGFIASLARPGGNITGFTNFEPSMGSKWLELLKEISPRAQATPAPCANPARAKPSVDPAKQASADTAAKRVFIIAVLALLPPRSTKSSRLEASFVAFASIGPFLQSSDGVITTPSWSPPGLSRRDASVHVEFALRHHQVVGLTNPAHGMPSYADIYWVSANVMCPETRAGHSLGTSKPRRGPRLQFTG